MDRELVLVVFAVLFCGAACVAFGAWHGRSAQHGGTSADVRRRAAMSGAALERHAWRRIWLPLSPAAVLLAFLLGWALQEPEVAEELPVVTLVVAVPFALLWLRATRRAWQSRRERSVAIAGAVGLLRPRVVVTEELRCHLDPAGLRAVLGHEAAHVRHRDPLRLWLAQIATDLQWPAAAAKRRFAQWRVALELARDEEARAHGIDGADLAAALLQAARLGAASAAGSPTGATAGAPMGATIAGLVSPSASAEFRERVMRLLQPVVAVPTTAARSNALLHWAATGSVLAIAIALGHYHGELIISQVAGVGF